MRKYGLLRLALIALFATLTFGSFAQTLLGQKIDIKDFHVVKNQNKVEINWSVDKKASTNYFEVEKSNDGKIFKTVAYVLGADPSKTNCECYGCFDKINIRSKESYYRLKHVDTNGQIQFSEVKMIALK